MLFEGKIIKVSKLQNSIDGNPRWAVWLDGLGRFTTPVDAGWVYGHSFGNYEGRTALIDTGKTKKTIQDIQVEGGA